MSSSFYYNIFETMLLKSDSNHVVFGSRFLIGEELIAMCEKF